MDYNQTELDVLKKVTPSINYHKKIIKIIDEIKEKIDIEIKNRKLPAEIELVGSTAKDTYLKDNLDIDFFLKFPTSFTKNEISKNALSIGKKLLSNFEESYAEHPYLRGYYNKYYVEIVPCYKIEKAEQKLSAVDRTPLHTKYVVDHIKETQKKDIRLFKQFLIGINCYGAEAEIEGFSGYLCEILILKYRSFRSLLKNAQKWKKGERLALETGNYQNFDTPLTFIDPVDANRNVASALSKEKFDLFKKAASAYLKQPTIKFFFPNKIEPWPLSKIKNEIEKQKCKYIGIILKKPDIIDENLFPQIRKATKSIWVASSKYGFNIIDIKYYINEKEKNIYIILKTDEKSISKSVKHVGPPLNLKENVDEFIKKWKDSSTTVKKPYEKNGRIIVEINRDYVDVINFLEDNIKNLSLGKHIDKVINKDYKVVELSHLLNEKLREFWTDYLDIKMSWER